jgi:hypothetical protein
MFAEIISISLSLAIFRFFVILHAFIDGLFFLFDAGKFFHARQQTQGGLGTSFGLENYRYCLYKIKMKRRIVVVVS